MNFLNGIDQPTHCGLRIGDCGFKNRPKENLPNGYIENSLKEKKGGPHKKTRLNTG
jgi:hypothetical protein